MQAAINIYGHSNILYPDKKKVVKKNVELGLPGDLALKLKNKNHYFNYIIHHTKKTELFIKYATTEIPEFLCVGLEDCY